MWRDNGLVNAEAGIFYPDPASYPAGLPVLHGPDNTSRQLLEHLALFREALPPHMSISALELSDRRSWRLQLAGGLEVRLGRTGAIERFNRFVRHFPYGAGGTAGIRYVDMRYTNGFSIRWEPEYKPVMGKRQANNGEKI
jgi:cell division protein FtsQ